MRQCAVLVCVCGCFFAPACIAGAVYEVQATIETAPVPHSGDRADDAKVWVHPTEPVLSVVIGSDKDDDEGGLIVYDLEGRQLQFVGGGKMNNIDVRYNVLLGAEEIDVVGAGNRTDNTIAVFRIDRQSRTLTDVTARKIAVNIEEAYGFCFYQNRRSGKLYAFVNDKNGEVEQWELFDDGTGRLDGRAVRRFDVGSQTEGMVADDEYGWLYVGEEDVAIWRYGAEPDDPTDKASRYRVDTTGSGGHIVADVEGMTIYYASDGRGYVIASSQGEDHSGHSLANTFAVYERGGNNAFVASFRIISNDALGIDGVSNTDGIGVTSAPLGPAFPYGVFVAQDGSNSGGNQNYKLVPWESIAGAVGLLTDAAWDPRGPCYGRFVAGDLSGDCGVDLVDAGIVARQWPAVDLLAAVAEHWLDVYVWPEPSTQNSVPAASGHKRFAFER
jgi:3-phytase